MPSITVPGGTTPAHEIHYEIHGEGEPVVLVAGSGSPGRVWHPHQVPALTAAGYQAITFDHRAAAPSGTDEIHLADLVTDTQHLVSALQLTPCKLIGVSLGAQVVQELLLAAPGLATQAVVAATRGRPDGLGAAMARAERALLENGVRLPTEYEAFARLTQNLSPRTLANETDTAQWLDMFEVAALSGGDAPHRTTGLSENRLTAYQAIRTPLLALGFADDVLAPARLSREVAEAVPAGRYAELPACGHLGHLERPAAFNEAVLRFFAETPAVPHPSGGTHAH
ncbi:alpha/beta fold hydrolase [Streptomyces sp. NPDC018045]|uniref:alpha/beta fold hydrolase n=1 Tax=Streptomyces sp. NPDC018045 TaxID=3365037 RepID=UPI00379379F4